MFWVLGSLAVPTKGEGETGRGEVEQQLNLSRWHLFYFLAWPSGVYLNWWLHHQTLAHQPTMALTTHVYTHLRDTTAAEWLCYGVALEKCMHVLGYVYVCVCVVVHAGLCVCVCLCVWHIFLLQTHTSVFIRTRPVKMSSLCLFSPHSEWHNTGLGDGIIKQNVLWHFLTPLSTT